MFSLFDWLGAGAGAAVYHLLILVALGAMFAISLIEWRHLGDPDHRRRVLIFGILLALRVVLAAIESLALTIAAPFANWIETVGLALLGWAFIAPFVERPFKGLYVPVWAGATFVLAAAFWPFWYVRWQAGLGLSYVSFWQQPAWSTLALFLSLVPVLVLLWERQREPYWVAMGGFGVLSLGSVVQLLVSLLSVLGLLPTYSTWIDAGRLIVLSSYPFFAVAVYRGALRDMGTYRQELQMVSGEALRQAREVFFLIEASQSIGEPLELETILRRVVESVVMALDADRAAIFLLDPEESKVVTLVAHYTPLQRAVKADEQLTFSLTELPLDYVFQRRKPLILNDQVDNPRLQALYRLLGSGEAGPTIVQPLLHQHRILGTLVVGNDRSQRIFESNHSRLCQSIAVQVTAAIENARLFQDLQAQTGQLASLLQAQEDEGRRRLAILESIAEGVIVTDGEGRIAVVNPAAERILGTSRKRVLGRSLRQLSGHTTLDPNADWGLVAESNTPLQTVFELENKVVHVSAAPVLTPAGDNLGVVAILRDITRESEAERAKSEFITAVSHELRTPLTAIQGYAEALASGMVGAVTDSQVHFFEVICDNVQRMNGLAENLIALPELEKGGLRLEYVETDLYLVIGEVVSDFRREIEVRKLELVLELGDNLPLIEADPARVRQVVANLVSNAVKFTYPGGQVTIGANLLREDVELSADLTKVHCAIWVEDTGIGISAEEQAHIWERFYRPENPLAIEAGGLGVGLSIVKSLVAAHGGRVWLESEPGEGSKFTVLLPVKRAHSLDQ